MKIKMKKGLIATTSTVLASSAIAIWQFTAPTVIDITKDTLKKSVTPILTAAISTELKKNDFIKSLNKTEEITVNLNEELTNKDIKLECKRNESEAECIQNNQQELMKLLGLDTLKAQLSNFDQAYNKCHEDIGLNPRIELNDSAMVYHETVKCLLLANQGTTLDILAKNDEILAERIKNIKTQIAHIAHD